MDADSNAAAVQAQLRALADSLQRDQSEIIEQALDDLIAGLQPVTPVRTGRMKAGYTEAVHGNVGELGNVMQYAKWVIGGTSRMHGNAALNDVIDSEERDLADHADLTLTRMVARYR